MSNILKTPLFIILVCLTPGCMTQKNIYLKTERELKRYLEKNQQEWDFKIVSQSKQAKWTIVHIQQQHYSDLYTQQILQKLKNPTPELNPEQIKQQYLNTLIKIERVQEEIYRFIVATTNEKDFLYIEGKAFPETYRQDFIQEYQQKCYKEIAGILNFGSAKSPQFPQFKFLTGASFTLHQEERLTLLGVENLEILNLALAHYAKLPTNENSAKIILDEFNEVREREMLKNLTENFDELPFYMSSLRFLLCGSAHDFENNVAEWNKKNPENQLNLLLLTPKSLKKP